MTYMPIMETPNSITKDRFQAARKRRGMLLLLILGASLAVSALWFV
ncbi:hypothetical protein IV417_06545 [Alphaproteobacteria bacterium KMM 3653]|uniref:Uncharacterized protein n=1 Tax=Harenicola maris TaxID=2841044 RepID=A0AAP2CR43_9RHOB|nr:hypothetical protein [Harenicola maris]